MLFVSHSLVAQDIIVKNDRTEIKSRVLEITESQVKYKKWQFQDGPLYNLPKSEIFMIMYANGQRELIKQSTAVSSAVIPTSPKEQTTERQQEVTLATPLAGPTRPSTEIEIDTVIDYKNIKVKYKPTRILLNFKTPVDFGFDQEVRIIKNVLNLGFAYHVIFPTDLATEQKMGFLYGSVYFPINRLSGNYKNQDKGLFLFGHAGYMYGSFKPAGGYGLSFETFYYDGFSYRFGADYLFSKRFGLSFVSYEFKTFYAGLVVSIL